ncbi:mucin-2-like, partial [Ochlerotatus camptorhynchus]|uniref:mucin-2-like n=1 Tax=Ochlerotatus camptorhynchus TaxID=644619 RepID=UPI0031D94AE2
QSLFLSPSNPQVRPQFRPALRRPGGPSFATTTSATPTTTARNKSTRRSESGETSTTDSTLLLTTTSSSLSTATSASLLSRRRRPTTYLSKLNSANRQRPAVLGGSSTVDEAAGDAAVVSGSSRRTATSTTTPAIDADQPPPPSKSTRPKVGVRRKFGPTRTGSEGGERGAAAATTTTTTTAKSPDLETTTRTNLFKRRPGFLSPNRITTPAPPVTTFSSPASKFFKNRSKPSPVTESPAVAADDQNPALLDGDVDQEIEPSIRQNSKLVNNKNRYNQIGEGDREGSLEDDLVGAITTISRAPLPSTTSRNFLFPNESPEEKNQHMQMMKVLNIGELPASHQRASTHKYNITHDYTPAQSFSEPFSTTRRSQKLIQRPRISTQSQFYYQQTTPSLYYSSSPVTLSPRKDTQWKRKPSSYEKSSYASANHRKQKDDFGGRTYRPAVDYDYYDDGEQRIISKSNSQVKVIMHGPGIIECLDQGNFPHPMSCKKFISCAKMEIGGVIGWEYTCPKGLSYDPVGGICNWSAGLGCKD